MSPDITLFEFLKKKKKKAKLHKDLFKLIRIPKKATLSALSYISEHRRCLLNHRNVIYSNILETFHHLMSKEIYPHAPMPLTAWICCVKCRRLIVDGPTSSQDSDVITFSKNIDFINIWRIAIWGLWRSVPCQGWGIFRQNYLKVSSSLQDLFNLLLHVPLCNIVKKFCEHSYRSQVRFPHATRSRRC